LFKRVFFTKRTLADSSEQFSSTTMRHRCDTSPSSSPFKRFDRGPEKDVIAPREHTNREVSEKNCCANCTVYEQSCQETVFELSAISAASCILNLSSKFANWTIHSLDELVRFFISKRCRFSFFNDDQRVASLLERYECEVVFANEQTQARSFAENMQEYEAAIYTEQRTRNLSHNDFLLGLQVRMAFPCCARKMQQEIDSWLNIGSSFAFFPHIFLMSRNHNATRFAVICRRR
jgi:hypothetical protein